MKIAKWGNSLAIRLPKTLVEALGLKEGDELTLTAQTIDQSHQAILIRKPTDEEYLERLRALRAHLPAHFKFNREEANER